MIIKKIFPIFPEEKKLLFLWLRLKVNIQIYSLYIFLSAQKIANLSLITKIKHQHNSWEQFFITKPFCILDNIFLNYLLFFMKIFVLFVTTAKQNYSKS